MKSGAKSEIGTHSMMETFSKLSGELGTSIGHYGFRNSMKTNDLGEVKLGIFLNGVVGFDRKEVSRFCESIHNDPNRIVPMKSTRKSGNKVHGYIFPLPKRNR